MSLPVAAQITILLAGGPVWLRAANKDVQHVPHEHQDLIIAKNRTVAAERLRYAGKDFDIENPETYFSTDDLEHETRKRLAKITLCLNANRRSRLYLRAIAALSSILIFLGIASVLCAAILGFLAASGMPEPEYSALFVKSLFLLGILLIGLLAMETCLMLHGREYENSRARNSLS